MLSNTDTIDAVATTPEGEPRLFIFDVEAPMEADERLRLLLEKLKTYVNFVASGQLQQQHSDMPFDRIGIQVVCHEAPTDAMLGISQVNPRGRPELAIKVAFQSPEGEPYRPTASPIPDPQIEQLLPRIVTADFFQRFPEPEEFPRTSLAATPLFVSYVLNAEHFVTHVTQSMMADLGLTSVSLHNQAVANLCKTIAADFGRRGLISLISVKFGDTFDASRLLLVPACLQEGEAVAAAIPDRDTLILGPLPSDDDWKMWRELAETPDSDNLICDRPLKVTRHGFEFV